MGTVPRDFRFLYPVHHPPTIRHLAFSYRKGTVQRDLRFLYPVHWPTLRHLAISLYSRDSPTRILDLQLVPFFQPTWATDQRDEIFLILVTISKIYLKELQYIKITEIKSLDEISTSEWNAEQNVTVFQGRLHQIFIPYYTIC